MRSSLRRRDVHVIVFDGRGGIFQHAAWLVRALAQSGRRATLHCDVENESRESEIRFVKARFRTRGTGSTRQRIGTYVSLLAGVMRVLAQAKRGSVIHFQGTAWSPIVFVSIVIGRLAGRRAVYTPHNTFDRSGSRVGAYFLRRSIGAAHSTIVFADRDVQAVSKMGGRAVKVPLVMGVGIDPRTRGRTRERWGIEAGQTAIMFAGQIRPDKGLESLIRTAPGWPPSWRLVVAGADVGSWESANALASDLGVDLIADIRYIDTQEFYDFIAASDVVVCPYERASQSGILTVADEVGVASVATDVGGLGEIATRTVTTDFTAEDIIEAITDALRRHKRRADDSDSLALRSHIAVYESLLANDFEQPERHVNLKKAQ